MFQKLALLALLNASAAAQEPAASAAPHQGSGASSGADKSAATAPHGKAAAASYSELVAEQLAATRDAEAVPTEDPHSHIEGSMAAKRSRVAQRRDEAAKEMDTLRAEGKQGPDDLLGSSLCGAWAADGECIRNPQYMFTACGKVCSDLTWVDLDDDCGGWAENGECEENAGFMLLRCNASCITHARKVLSTPRQLNRNEHTLQDALRQVRQDKQNKSQDEFCSKPNKSHLRYSKGERSRAEHLALLRTPLARRATSR